MSDNEPVDWRFVESVIGDLKADGYDVVEFNSDTSATPPSKEFTLVVQR